MTYRSIYVEEKNVDHGDWGLFLNAAVKQRPNMYFRCIVFEGEELSELSLFRVKEYEVGVATLKVYLEPSPELSSIYHPEKGIIQYDNLSKEMRQKLEASMIVHAYADLQSGRYEIPYEQLLYVERFKRDGGRVFSRIAATVFALPLVIITIWGFSDFIALWRFLFP